jgi:hypothetical protein
MCVTKEPDEITVLQTILDVYIYICFQFSITGRIKHFKIKLLKGNPIAHMYT